MSANANMVQDAYSFTAKSMEACAVAIPG